ncbi:LLM class flavin-dependent oxidoreductase [Dictyobacter kobayashii]|uniref:Luciferase-like domain-containing protein n=1 Tax=Dictyobacter kobayashii TaxID=2014872 RepID=A0A402ARJ8_9CHLR|nr:LLM class flavin-dependent oxidoreductase [Dictyobacter kobayashii]GCE21717.1 hypothetical protein KDK_55170 [Dictyobacter kobayashii]
MVDKYIATARGVIVYDPHIIDSVNVATTMAGLDDGVVVSPQLMKRLTAAPYNMSVLADLRGKFSSNLQANIWQVQNLWPRASHRLLVGLLPTTPSQIAGHVTTYGYLRDYAVANRAMVFWFSLQSPTEINLFRQVLSTVTPGTPYLGWYDKEFRGVRLTSSYGVYTIAADYFSNLTVFSGVRAPSLLQKTAPSLPLRNKIYVTFTMSEGDNFQYVQHAMRHLWEDPQRGNVPLNWSINPLLYDAAPTMLNHYQLTASANDYLVAGPSGGGYAYPSNWLFSNLNSFMRQSNNYMQKAGLHVIFIIDDQTTIPSYVSHAYSAYAHTSGILYNWWNPISRMTVSAGNLPVSTQVTATTRLDMLKAIRLSASQWNGRSPLFISALAISWNLSPTDIKYVVDHLGSNYRVVRGDQYFQLFRAARGCPLPIISECYSIEGYSFFIVVGLCAGHRVRPAYTYTYKGRRVMQNENIAPATGTSPFASKPARERVGLVLDGSNAAQAVRTIVEAEGVGVRQIWMTQMPLSPDTLTTMAAAATQTNAIRLGTSIIPTYPRHPLTMAMQALAINDLAPGRLRLGIGPSHRPIIEGMYGIQMVKPLEHLREYVEILRGALWQGRVEHHGNFFNVNTTLPRTARYQS